MIEVYLQLNRFTYPRGNYTNGQRSIHSRRLSIDRPTAAPPLVAHSASDVLAVLPAQVILCLIFL
jgi:hypothetical protein